MKKVILIIIVFNFAISSFAQTGIGTTTPNASAKLDVYSTNKGFLPPRVTLTSETDASTIASPAEGLLVYNLGSVGLQAGYYYWNGANWATIATASSAGNGVTASDLVKLYQETYSTTTGKASSSSGYSFTVPVSGRYEFNFNCTGWNTNGSLVKLTFNIREGTTVIGTDYHQSASSNAWVEYEGRFEVNLTAGVTYNAQVVTTTGSRQAGYDWDKIMYKLVAGNLPVTGQTVDYVNVMNTVSQTVVTGNNIKFNNVIAGNIPYDATTGNFTLTANKTYRLSGYVTLDASSGGSNELALVWKNAAGTYLGPTAELLNANFASTTGGQGVVDVIYTPTSNTTVSLYVGYASGTSITRPSYTSATITQIGSSAIINPWVLSGNDVYNTSGDVGIGNTTPNAKLDVRTNTTSTTDPGDGTIGLGTSSTTAAASGKGALRFNNSTNKVEVSTGSEWQGASSPIFAQFLANASQSNISTGTKLNFQTTVINVGGITIASNNTITLPAGRIYRIDFNAGWVSMGGGWARFAIYNNGTIASIPAHLEAVSGNSAINSSGATTTFINTSSGSTTIDVRYLAPSGSTVSVGDSASGTSYPYIVIQAVD